MERFWEPAERSWFLGLRPGPCAWDFSCGALFRLLSIACPGWRDASARRHCPPCRRGRVASRSWPALSVRAVAGRLGNSWGIVPAGMRLFVQGSAFQWHGLAHALYCSGVVEPEAEHSMHSLGKACGGSGRFRYGSPDPVESVAGMASSPVRRRAAATMAPAGSMPFWATHAMAPSSSCPKCGRRNKAGS